ncbi:MAG TPA: DNA-binding response regulator [Trichocoleus sp.]|jgi:YesN/AraC family two-component response regulator
MREETLKKVLVIEPHTEVRSLFVQGLEANGFRAIGAGNGQTGIQQAQEHLPDVITCGIMMSELDGYSVLTKLRQNPTTAGIPLIFVTAKMSRTDLRRAMELGANDYLTKPCTIEELIRAVTAQLKKQSLLQQWYERQYQPVLVSQSNESKLFTPLSLPIELLEPPLSEVFRFIEANYHRSIALSDVAQAVGYSPAYLTNLSKRQTGQTVQRWIIERRMKAACSLLLETNEAVEQIAMLVGYHHTVHFFRQFRQFHGTTPRAWRNAHRHQRSHQLLHDRKQKLDSLI